MLRIYGDLKQFPDYSKRLQSMVDRFLSVPGASIRFQSGSQGGSSDRAPSDYSTGRIQFHGSFPNHKLGEVLSEIDVLVVPSRWYENTPLVIQSAFATRTPVVATDLGGLSELVRHEINGLLFKLNDADSLAEQLLRLINDRGLLRGMRNNIPPERTTSEMVDDIEGIYNSVCWRSTAARVPGGSADLLVTKST